MGRDPTAEQAIQRDYYAATADQYDQLHHSTLDEHQFALAWLRGAIDLFGIKSVLDIGSGTGRALAELKRACPGVKVVGVEPSKDLREAGGFAELVDGDAQALQFADGEFDIVTEFGALHHIPDPAKAVSEMLRVARVGILISDSNRFGQGSSAGRLLKRGLYAVGLWPLFDRLRTGGKGYMISDGDGLFYSYSVFDNYALIRRACASVHILNTHDAGINPRSTAPTVAILGLKQALISHA